MCQPSLSLWFVCRLCRGSFGQVDAFIEHKKQKHFTQFQNTTSIVFEEVEQGPLCAVQYSGDHHPADEINEPSIKIEVSDEDPIIPFIDEPNLDLVEPKSELITYESEIAQDTENDFFDVKELQQNPYVLLKRLTSEEIQTACVLKHHSILVTFKQKNQFECKLCSKQLESDAQLKIHVGICALYHKHRNRFCVTCNRKFSVAKNVKHHRLRFHGTEEDKLSLYKFKCQVCTKQYRDASELRFHMESHRSKEQQVSISNSKLFKCSHQNCGQEFRFNSKLQRHINAVHLGSKPFSCPVPNCNKKFPERASMKAHCRIHTGERPFKCTVANCNKTFMFSCQRSKHRRTVHNS